MSGEGTRCVQTGETAADNNDRWTGCGRGHSSG
jgi:hypothetical protein